MNRFRSRKKPLDGGETDLPPVPSHSRTFRRNKKSAPEPKQSVVDIATALPSSDDFRTSLLMPNLSARFSMLREQDDPASKIGKANDDSVLFPRRASRLNLFYRNDLTDIAEAASREGSIRPAFASTKAHSYGSSDGYATDDGNVMNRPRPGEGNNLFGGRQKIYRIAIGARSSTGDGTGNEDLTWASGKGMGGRALYEDDVALSAFTKPAQPDKQDSPEPPSVRSSQAPQRSDSPIFTYNHNHKRETTSSTTSVQMESRASTAATSIASQRSMNGVPGNSAGSPQPTRASTSATANSLSMDRQAAKSRRLYGQGLDQHIYDQQSSAMHRLESLQRQRALGASSLPKNLSQSRSGHNLQDRYQCSGASGAPGPHRAASPPASGSPSRLREFDLGLSAGPSAATSQTETGYFRSPPLSPPVSPVPDPTLVAALEPNDVGKATALGAFNKPSKQFDEQQFVERQLQLQQRRDSPPIAHPSSPLTFANNQLKTDRPRTHSPVSPLSRSNSSDTGQPRDPDIRIVSEIYHGGKKEPPRADETQPDLGESFLSTETPSDIGSPLSDTRSGNRSSQQTSSTNPSPMKWRFENPKPEKPRDMDHPIHRQQQQQQQQQYRTHLPFSSEKRVADHIRENVVSQTPEKHDSVDREKRTGLNADSPTLGPANEVTGLNGLVHTHLRNDSGQSSIYPEPSPPLESKFPDNFRRENPSSHHDPEVRSSETFFRKSTWEDDGLQGKPSVNGAARQAPVAVPPPLSLRARHVLEQAAALQKHPSSKVQNILGLENTDRIVGREAPRRMQEAGSIPGWQEQLKTHHTRGGSTETEKERQSFANELAERRRMVQDNLKSFVENESRSNSPMPANRTLEHSPSKPGSSFGILRSKTSKGTLGAKPEHSSKAMKMLGISVGPGPSNGGGSLQPRQERLLEQEDEHMAKHGGHDLRFPMHQSRPVLPDSRQNQNPIFAQRRIEMQLNNDRRQDHFSRRSPPQSKASSREDRSNSDSSDRDGRNGRLANPAAVQDRDIHIDHHPSGAQARTHGNFSRPAAADQSNTIITSPVRERSQPAMSDRFRSNSNLANPPGAGYIDSRGNLPRYPSSVQTSSPGSTQSSLSTPSYEPTPNSSNMTTPFMMAPSSYSTPATRLPGHRKRSINKHDISDPTFVSSTSSISTVDLPPGASLSNGMEAVYSGPPVGGGMVLPPPIPPINPRRRRTQTLRQALGRLDNKPEAGARVSPTSQPDLSDDRSTFSADESERAARYRTRLRKTSSEGGNMNYRARQQMMLAPSPAMPTFPQSHSAGPSPAMSHFPHSLPTSGSGTGVMF